MRVNKYKFKIRRNTTSGYDITEVYPHFKSLKKKYAFESGQRFFRETLEGKIQFFGENFELIYNSSYETKFTFIIEREVSNGTFEEYFKGTFSKTDCKFDIDHKICEPKISPSDSYSNIMNNYENTYELLEIPPVITPLYLYKRPCIQVYITGGYSITNFVGGTYWEQDTNESVYDEDILKNKYYFSLYGYITEVTIKNVGSGIDGTYSVVSLENGINKIYNENGYYLIYNPSVDNVNGYYELYSPSGTLLYRSDAVTKVGTGGAYIPLFDNTTPYYLGNTVKFYSRSSSATVTPIEPTYTMARKIYQRLLCDVGSVTDSEGTKSTYDIPLEDIVPNNNNYKKVIGLKSENSIIATSKTVKTPTRYGINDYGDYFTSAFIPTSTGLNSPLPLNRNSWNNVSIWYVYSIGYDAIDSAAKKKYKLKDAFKLSDVIKALLSKVAPGITHEATTEYSQFLYGSQNPITNDSFTLFITPKSNVLKGEYDQAAQKASISLKDVMNMLMQCFRCYWHIENGKFKIEHISWYNNGRSYSSTPQVQYDLTTMTDPKNLKHIGYKQTSIEFDKSELASRYEFEWMDTVTDAFKGTSIDVKSEYIDKSLKNDVSVQNFTSDIDYMLLSPEDFSMDGFALMAAKNVNSSWELPFIKFDLRSAESHLAYTLNLQNGYLSWFYLVQFYMRDMPARNIKFSELKALEVVNIKPCIEQELRFSIFNTTPDLYSVIKTDLGSGLISSIAIDLISKQADVTIMSRP